MKSNIWPEPILCEQCRVNSAQPGKRICWQCQHSADEKSQSTRKLAREIVDLILGAHPHDRTIEVERLIKKHLAANAPQIAAVAVESPREGWETTVNGPGYVEKGFVKREELAEQIQLADKRGFDRGFVLGQAEVLNKQIPIKAVAARCPHCGSAFGADMIGKNCYVCNTANVTAVPEVRPSYPGQPVLRMEEYISGEPLKLYQKIRAVLIRCNHFADDPLAYKDAVEEIRKLL